VRRPHVQLLFASCAYALVAVFANWPLPVHLSTHVTGTPSGDTGIYVWNLWVFHHEAVHNHHLPFLTGTILSMAPPIDLSLHNYTTFANVLALPFVHRLGVVTTFNLVYLALVVLTASAMFVLLRSLLPDRAREAWVGGLLFGFCPALVARSTAHFSLVAAAPLPIFILALMRAERTGSWRWAAVTGCVVAWAAFCDVYYGIYCLLIAACRFATRIVRLTRIAEPRPRSGMLHTLDLLMAVITGLIIGVAVGGGGALDVSGAHLSLRSLYTPVLVLTILALIRLAISWKPKLTIRSGPTRRAVGQLLAGAVATTAILSPVLYGFGRRVLTETSEVNPILYWRSSPPGVDLLSFVLPNPNHPIMGRAGREWLTAQPDGFAELTASIPFVALAVIGVVMLCRKRLPAGWIAFTLFFGLLSLGPFVHIAGVNTHVPGPWALMRYVPIVGLTRAPARFAIPMMLGVAVLFTYALATLSATSPHRRRWLVALVTLALIAELSPAPRTLYSAEVPAIYQVIARDPDKVRVLELPFGVRDGTSSLGNFSAITQFHQTVHGKDIIGGYLSRVSSRRKETYRQYPVLNALITLSEGGTLETTQRQSAWAARERFLERSNLRYVVMDESHTSPALRAFAIELLGLEQIGADRGYSLWRVPSG
jgi:hypothetical protein